MMKRNLIFGFILLMLTVISCSRVPITGRKQFKLLPNDVVLSMSRSSYQEFLAQHPPLPASNPGVMQVRKVGDRISSGVGRFLQQNNMSDRIPEYTWEFNVVDDKTVNAWCMPGGKIVFYSGILPVASDDNGIATVMGHEIGHAVAEHGNERMTEQLAIYLGGISLEYALQKEPQTTKDIFLTAYGVGSQLGVLAYSRKQEYEADKLGMVFMAMSGYDPATAITFWQRMAQTGGAKPPEFLSTHPNDENRIKALQAFLPQAGAYYNSGQPGTTPGKKTKVIKLH